MVTDTHYREFESQRKRLMGVAYRMLGSVTEAEDALQDAFMRWREVSLAEVGSPAAYLTTTVTRLCIDRLRRAKSERNIYQGPWLPEPVGDMTLARMEPDTTVEKAEHISLAFLLLLEKLQPLERAVFILREAFDFTHDEIARTLEIRSAHSRQLLRRARQRIDDGQPVTNHGQDDLENLLTRFLEAAESGNLAGLKALMTNDIIAFSDGGGRASAALIPLEGPDRVATVFAHLVERELGNLKMEWRRLNGDTSLVMKAGNVVHSTHTVTLRQGLIHRIYTIRNPDKLGHLE